MGNKISLPNRPTKEDKTIEVKEKKQILSYFHKTIGLKIYYYLLFY